MTDLDKLEALAKRCTSGDPWYTEGDLCGRQTFGQFLTQDRAFIAAANPSAILDLIASARRDAEEIERLKREVEAGQSVARAINRVLSPQHDRTFDMLIDQSQWAVDTCRAYLARAAHTGEG